MDKIIEKTSKMLMPFAKFMNTNKYLTTIRDAFVLYMPFIMVGSFASLFTSLLCSDTIGLAAIDMFSWVAELKPAFNALNFATISCMSLIIVAIIGGLLGKKNGMKTYTSAGIAFCCYIALIPQELTAKVEEATTIVNNVISASSFNAQGLFLAIFVALVSIELFSFLMKFEKIKIKMPDEVPEGIASSFNAIIPTALTLFGIAIAGSLFKVVTGLYINEWFYSVLQAPFHSITETPLGLMIIVFMTQILWWFGIHGGMVMSSVTEGLMIAGLAANIEAVNAGTAATHWFTKAFNVTYLAAGGSGIVVSLLACLILFSKREDYKKIAKACLVPALFSISEPAVFGLPIILNPIFLIPFVIAPMITGLFGYIINYFGLLACSIVDQPFGLPIFVRPFVGYQSLNVLWICLLVFVIAFIVYLPFVLISNRMYEKEIAENKGGE